jgi:predicted Fe-Mo cluster-binding NifX family protein
MIDQRFGRCAFLAIYDSDIDTVEYIPNPNKDVPEGAGPATVELVASQKVDKVISGAFGNKIRPLLESLNIQMLIRNEPNIPIDTIIKNLNR